MARALTLAPSVATGDDDESDVDDATVDELAGLLAALSEYLDAEASGREFVPTAELGEALDLDPR